MSVVLRTSSFDFFDFFVVFVVVVVPCVFMSVRRSPPRGLAVRARARNLRAILTASMSSRVVHGRAGLALILVLALGTACARTPEQEAADYVKRVEASRAEKDRMFSEGSDSPIPASKRVQLLPLNYFPVDPEYSVPAELKLQDERPTFPMPTSTGQLRQMQLVGLLEFTLKGKPLKLGAFVEAGQPLTHLFVPFTDLTTGTETYAAGRYLDLDPTATGLYVIDFNRAYHPYCYYNEAYDCPYPPRSNRLQVPIRAGERLARGTANAGLGSSTRVP